MLAIEGVKMRQKRLVLLALVLVTTLSGIATAQETPREAAQRAIGRGHERFARAEYEAAIEEYRRVPAEANEIYAQSLYNIGVSFYELWRTQDAIQMYLKAIQAMKGHYPTASYALGVALNDSGRRTEAKAAFKQTIEASGGKHSMAHYMLGVLLMDEDFPQAAALFKEAIASAKGHFPASHNNLGVMLAKMGRLSEAEREFEVALKQAGGKFGEATHNLQQCRSLQTPSLTKAQAASLMTVETGREPEN
jgi:tetratricopeptide (TPR) repeat protein